MKIIGSYEASVGQRTFRERQGSHEKALFFLALTSEVAPTGAIGLLQQYLVISTRRAPASVVLSSQSDEWKMPNRIRATTVPESRPMLF